MELANLWEKYGETAKPKTQPLPADEQDVSVTTSVFSPREDAGAEVGPLPQPTKQLEALVQKSALPSGETRAAAPRRGNEKTESLKDAPNNTSPTGDVCGIFGQDSSSTKNVPSTNRRTDQRTRRRIPKLRNWPWVDIIMIGLTLLLIVLVLTNFQSVTNSIFSFLVSVISSFLNLALIVAVIALAIWFVFRRRRRLWR